MEKNVITQENKIQMMLDRVPKSDIKRKLGKEYLINLMKNNPGLTMEHISEFAYKCQVLGANPLLKDIYLVPFFNQRTGTTEAQTFVSYFFLLECCDSQGNYDGLTTYSEPVEIPSPHTGEMIKTWKSTCVITKAGKEYKASTYLHEFNKNSNVWKDKKIEMLEKCAIVKAARRCWPKAVKGLHIEEERELLSEIDKVYLDKEEKKKRANNL